MKCIFWGSEASAKNKGHTFKCRRSSRECFPPPPLHLAKDTTCDFQGLSFSASFDHHPSQERRMKSSPESRATVPQRLMFKEGRKVGRKSVLCHWKGFASGRGEGENKGRRAGRGVKRELGPKRKRGKIPRVNILKERQKKILSKVRL